MEPYYCTSCAQEMNREAVACPKCGYPNDSMTTGASTSNVSRGKSRVTAGVLGILLGGLGVHKFYLNQYGKGVLYLLFSWSGVPFIVGFIEGIIYLVQDDKTFSEKQQVRV